MIALMQPYQYVIDSSALFDLKELYPEKIFSGVWERFNEMCHNKLIVAPREVLREIKRGNDHLIDWAQSYEHMFLEPTEDEQLLNQEILNHYPKDVIAKYGTRPWADPLVISCAKFYNLPIIQHETNDPNQYKIPSIARKFGVTCLRLVKFFEDEEWEFRA
jgi:hypothetical protein